MCSALTCALLVASAVSAFALGAPSPLALDLMSTSADGPRLWLAQRSIEREWVTRDDPEAMATMLPGGKSEPGAMSMSALIPGTGQLYTGNRSGYAYMLAEAIGWAGLFYFDNKADDQYHSATGMVGAPSDSASAWSFQRYADATGDDPATLEQLYQADPSSFWYAVAHDDRLASGWTSTGSRASFADQLTHSNDTRRRVGQFEGFLWLNHLVSAADAFRAARIYNLPLQRNLQLKTKASISHGRPELAMTLVRTF